MPIKRKLLDLGSSYGVTIPKSWVKDAEEKEGRKMVALTMEINGEIVIKPFFEGNHIDEAGIQS